jgi:DNA-binding response OmpR family regulator
MINVVIISKDIIFINLMQAMLWHKLPACNIFQFSSFPEVKDKIEGDMFDFIIVDGMVSGVASFEIVNFLRIEKKITTPIYFFSEVHSESFKSKAFETGVSNYYEKPFDPVIAVNQMTSFILQLVD